MEDTHVRIAALAKNLLLWMEKLLPSME